MLLPALLLATLFSHALAQYANLFAINWPIVAYAIASDNEATTYLVACTAGSIQTCDFVQPLTMVSGQSTIALNYTGLGGLGSVTMSLGCVLTSTTYAACSASGGVRVTSGPSTDILIGISPTTSVVWTDSTAATMLRSVLLVRDSALLLTYTPPGASVIPVSTVTTEMSLPSSTSYYGSNSLITTPPTATPSSSTGSSPRGAGLVEGNLGKAFGAIIAAVVVLGII